jgi:DNA mismatch repair protein PMS2
MATIKPIEGRSVHQIQSGQVIVDLQSVCKELVENSIDAGATSVGMHFRPAQGGRQLSFYGQGLTCNNIEVRFKNNGLDAIEVQDNGGGIAPEDYETIALKHYTSKLSSYDDLSSLQTFGFRGEALSSLCALSNFHIVTACPTDGAKATKLEFEQSGKLKGTSVVAAKQGTTVVVETLFYNLPVRRKELEKNIKREYNKVLQLLSAYACISVGVKFIVSNSIPKG